MVRAAFEKLGSVCPVSQEVSSSLYFSRRKTAPPPWSLSHGCGQCRRRAVVVVRLSSCRGVYPGVRGTPLSLLQDAVDSPLARSDQTAVTHSAVTPLTHCSPVPGSVKPHPTHHPLLCNPSVSEGVQGPSHASCAGGDAAHLIIASHTYISL